MKTLLALAVTLLLSVPAQAAYVTYDFILDQARTSYFTVDTSVQDTDPATDRETYAHVLGQGGDGTWVVAPGAFSTPQVSGGTLSLLHTGVMDHVTFTTDVLSASQPYLFTMTWDTQPSSGGTFPSLGHITNGQWSSHWIPTCQMCGDVADVRGVLKALGPHGANLTPVPLPPSVVLFGAGLLVLMGIALRQRSGWWYSWR